MLVCEFNGPRGDFYKNMFAKCSAGRPGTADEVANVTELLMRPQDTFITESDFLIDGGAVSTTIARLYGLSGGETETGRSLSPHYSARVRVRATEAARFSLAW